VFDESRDLSTREILPIRSDRYATDSVYRRRMAEAMGVGPGLPGRNALADVAARRPLCLTPTADIAATPPIVWTPFRLTRVSQTVDAGQDALSFTQLLEATRQAGSAWLQEVRGVYDSAARFKALLCSSLLLVFGDAASGLSAVTGRTGRTGGSDSPYRTCSAHLIDLGSDCFTFPSFPSFPPYETRPHSQSGRNRSPNHSRMS